MKEANFFDVTTKTEKYSVAMSDLKDFPFQINCNNKQKITVTVSSGILFDEAHHLTKTNDNYEVSCQKTIYWNFSQEENHDSRVVVHFKSNDPKRDEKKFIIVKNENQEHSILGE